MGLEEDAPKISENVLFTTYQVQVAGSGGDYWYRSSTAPTLFSSRELADRAALNAHHNDKGAHSYRVVRLEVKATPVSYVHPAFIEESD